MLQHQGNALERGGLYTILGRFEYSQKKNNVEAIVICRI
jgi:hypothetical protein